MIVGLTGGIGSGKTIVANIFRALNVEVIEADQMARELVEPNLSSYNEILEHFGNEILNVDNTINRAKLRTIIFESKQERVWLEQLLHPLIKEEIKKRIKQVKENYLIVDIPLLLEANFQDLVDRVLVVDCSKQKQIERIEARDNIPHEVILKIIDSQVSQSERLSKADDVIENDGSKSELKEKVVALHHYYMGSSRSADIS